MVKPQNEIFNAVYDDVNKSFRTTTNLEVSDIQIGAVEIKDGTTDNRAFVDSAGNLYVNIANTIKNYYTNDLEENKNTKITYIGKEKKDGTWLIIKIDESNNLSLRAANIVENPGFITYFDAWANKENLTYGYFKDIL